MNEQSSFADPAFAIPLDDEQLIQLGRIAVLWGQVDFFVDELLLYAAEIDVQQRKLLLGDMAPIGKKAQLIAGGLNRIKPAEVRTIVQRFLGIVQRTKTLRNSAFHGVWGHQLDGGKPDHFEVAAYYAPSSKNPIKPKHFRQLIEDLTTATRLADIAITSLKGWSETVCPAAFTFGGGETGSRPPKWLQQQRGPFEAGRSPRDQT